MSNEKEVSKEALDATEKVYKSAFKDRCEQRGYTHLTDQEKTAEAIELVSKLREKLNKDASDLTREAYKRIKEDD